MNDKLDTAAIIETAKRSVDPKVINITRPEKGGGAALVLFAPVGMEPVDVKEFLDEYLEAPERREGTATLEDLDSFIEHVNRFKDDDSAIFARREPPRLLAVIDYHRKGATGAPRFGGHKSAYTFPLSDEWKAWIGSNGAGKAMSQATFAEFIETRIIDVRDPELAGDSTRARLASINATAAAPWRLLNLSRGLAIKAGVSVQNAVNLSTGETQIEFVTTHQDVTGKALDVPGAFIIQVPVFQRGDAYEIPVRLRYRLREGVITWFYEMLGHDVVLDDAFKGATDKAKTATNLPLLLGSPET